MATKKLARRKSVRKTPPKGGTKQRKASSTARALERDVEREQRELVKETEGGLRAGGFRVARGQKKKRPW